MEKEKIKIILQKQLEVLSKRSEEEGIDVSRITYAMIEVVDKLLMIN